MRRIQIFLFMACMSFLAFCMSFLFLYEAFSLKDNRFLYIALALIPLGAAGTVFFFKRAAFADKTLKRRWFEFYLNFLAYQQAKEENPNQTFDYKEILDGVRKNYFSDTAKRKNRVEKESIQNAKRFYDFSVLHSGDIYYGRLVGATAKLFRPARMIHATLPAVFVYSKDEYYKENPKELNGVVEWVRKDVLDQLFTDKKEFFFNQKLCSEQTGNREVYVTYAMVCRRQLPLGHFMGGLLPIIANPENSSSVFVVDCKYWTNDFANFYFDVEEKKDSYGDPFDI